MPWSRLGIGFIINNLFIYCTSISGAIKDSTGTFELAYLMMGCMTTLAGVLYALEPVARRLEESRHRGVHGFI